MSNATLREVSEAWERLRQQPVQAMHEAFELACQALALGHPTLACEILREPSRQADAPAQLRYTAALAQARIGGYREAEGLLAGLLGETLPEALRIDVLSLAGRIAKDQWARTAEGAQRNELGELALQRYRAAWQATGSAFPGINTATLLALTGQHQAARELALRVRQLASRDDGAQEGHWRSATLGEACVLLGDWDAAAQHYTDAVRACGQQVGHLASMRRQIKLIGRSIALPAGLLEALAAPQVVVFVGHMIDAPDCSVPRFPACLEATVATAIEARLESLQAGFGYASAACGADLLFCEAMLARGAELHLTLPFDASDFLATSVAFAGARWVERYHTVCARASSISYGVRERFLGDEALYTFAAEMMQGAALLHARELETEPLMLAVIDHDSGLRAGGTRHTMANWTGLGLRCEAIELGALRRTQPASQVRDTSIVAPVVALRSTAVRREVHSMLFADVVGYSNLAEEDTPAFLLNFLGAIALIVRDSERQPDFVNTWGDGLFMVFDTVQDAADFALRLRDAVRETEWQQHGLPAGTSIRIGMHTGPVFPAMDPLVGRPSYFGSHVVRAARIEPITAPGSVYVSAELGCVLAASGDVRFTTDYLGVQPLAKGFGQAPLYRLRRCSEAE
jgi:class 3 adenylate cyclase